MDRSRLEVKVQHLKVPIQVLLKEVFSFPLDHDKLLSHPVTLQERNLILSYLEEQNLVDQKVLINPP